MKLLKDRTRPDRTRKARQHLKLFSKKKSKNLTRNPFRNRDGKVQIATCYAGEILLGHALVDLFKLMAGDGQAVKVTEV
ncbi:hypothetical protein F6455_13975 [Proteobacteria bacterium 005FR1]|nr:hypothetical protein [Proteobacteria bacterium 005FR1]